jgi:uncharacterized protein YjbJ (UPF0337 family)
MNKDQIKGTIDNIKGRIKQAVGTTTGDKQTEAEGLGERVKGAVQEKVGDVKHAVSDRQAEHQTEKRTEEEEAEAIRRDEELEKNDFDRRG